MARGLYAQAVSLAFLAVFSLFPQCPLVQAAISADPTPPYQWLNITGLLQGSTRPPGLKDASMGYDETSRSIIIFGGEASSTVPQGQTYLLDLNTLTWSVPTPPTTLTRTPPARSAAGTILSISSRNGFIVVGGKGADGAALSDVWEYDFNHAFWTEINISPSDGPSPRWGSSGGIDIRVPAVSDLNLPGPNNTFWLWGGSNGTSAFSDLWRLNVSGALGSNLPDDTEGSWEHLPLSSLPGVVNQGGSVIFNQIVTSGGCNNTTVPADSCAVQETYVINAGSTSGATEMATLNCPAPRLSPVVIPSGNTNSNTFASQMLVLLGTFNNSLWNDGDGLKQGEVAILDVMTQSWTRILPSGDPGTSGKESFPSPREGAAAVMFPLSLVGDTRTISSDVIVFGGKDESGNYLSEMWVLRSYNGVVTQADPKWSGFGDGKLQTGPNAAGVGVQNTFITSCAFSVAPSGSPTASHPTASHPTASSSGGAGPTPSSGASDSMPATQLNTSLLHKLFAPISIALLLPSFVLFRSTSRFFNSDPDRVLPRIWFYVSLLLAAAAYGLGIGGIITSFTSLTSTVSTRPPTLSTVHGRAGLSLFICLYGLAPFLVLLHASTKSIHLADADEAQKCVDSDGSEKDQLPRSTPSPALSTRRRTQSWGPSGLRKAHDSMSLDSGSAELSDPFPSAPAQRTFEVLNRPARTRRASGRHSVPLVELTQHSGSHSYGELDWLNRRRSLDAVGELDFPLDQAAAAAALPPSTPGGTLLEAPIQTASPSSMPRPTFVPLRLIFQAFLLAFCVFTLVTLWSKAPKSTFAIFLIWTAAFYSFLIASAWRGKPDRSTGSVLFTRLRTEPRTTAPRPSVSDTLPETDENAAFPYIHHRPAYRRALLTDTIGIAPQVTTDTEEDDDRAEDEMRRRDISIVSSYPKRPLRITNPSPS
ncbi:hypothetical protein GGX14DRAFT_414199 [Mycena pura]|uniref:Galactose oxidase n=1 Tax=Mycena pura TaxID=153505 RepID=A0AAD6YT87_9AGAR|nr:hypothetical protein GGX14DRAFT_414199 [Mycena pura]